MRRIRYSVAASLDGFITDANGGAEWIPMDPDIDFGAIFAQFDTLLMGRRTFEVAARQGQETTPGMRTVVVSRTIRQQDHPGVVVVSDDVPQAVRTLREQPGKDIWLFGGGELFRTLLQANLRG